MAVQLVTFGGLHVADESGELDWLLGQHSRAALFVYLATERTVSREALTTIFWPESDAENARHALRQSLYQLRKAVGVEWIDSRAHELVVTGDVRTDTHDFADAIERRDIPSAIRLYRGPFLDGVHLVDLKPWESWVDDRRAQYARTFRKACRDAIAAKHAAGDDAGAIETAERWAAVDPLDDEAQHRLIETLAASGERAEAIRQYETYERRLKRDGMHPPDETVRLAVRIRSAVTEVPALRHASAISRAPATAVEAAATPSAPPTSVRHTAERRRPTGRRAAWLLVTCAVLFAVFAAVWSLRRTTADATPNASATTIAVLPFSVRGGESVQYLTEGIVNLLGAALDGAGSLRPVDARATFAAVSESGKDVARDPRHSERVASRLGARMFVLGDVVEAGGRLQIEAAVYRISAECARSRGTAIAPSIGCPPAELRTKAVVSGAADSVFGLVDRLAARLLGGLGDREADRLLRTAALTTTSLPAFKSYLQGEELMRSGQFERAAEAYLGAIAQDSTFAVAHYRLALAREWAPLPGEDAAASAAAHYSERLSARDRALLEAFRRWRAGDAVEADRAYRALLARYPDDIDAWFQLGEIRFHHWPLLGHPLTESEEAWRRVLSSEPRNLFALTHLGRIAVVDGRSAALDSLLERFDPDGLRMDRRLAEIVMLRAMARGDEAGARTLAKELARRESSAVWRETVFLTAFSPDPAMTRAVIDELLRDFADPGLRADVQWFASLVDLARGRFGAAHVARTEATQTERGAAAPTRRSEFDAVTEWFAATLPLPYADSTLASTRRRAMSHHPAPTTGRSGFEHPLGIGMSIQVEPLRQYTLGVLSLALADTTAAAAAGATLQRLAASVHANALVRDLDRGLRARLEQHAGRPEQALRLLEAMESRDTQGDVAATPFVSRASERFLRGELLVSLGRHAEALPWYASLGVGSVTEVPLQALAHYRQAEIHERLGNRDVASRHYARCLELWRDADQEFRPLVDTARQGLARVIPPR